MDREALVITLAKAISGAPFPSKKSISKAEATISAIESAGLKIMGREPTAVMDKAAVDADDLRTGYETWKHMYRTAWDAAPTYTDKEQT